MKLRSVWFLALLPLSFFAAASDDDCSSWPRNMAETWLKNRNIVDISQLDEAKTQTLRLASEKKTQGISTDIYHFVFFKKDGEHYEIITKSDSSRDECSISAVDIYFISQSEVND